MPEVRPRSRSPKWHTGKRCALTFDAEEHMLLRRRSDQPVVGIPMGMLPSNPQQSSQLGAPFVYTREHYDMVAAALQKPAFDAAGSSSSTVAKGGDQEGATPLAGGDSKGKEGQGVRSPEKITDQGPVLDHDLASGAAPAHLSAGGGQRGPDGPLSVVADLSRRGYFVVNGMRHGCDLVVYEGDPVRHHGSYFLNVASEERTISPRELVLWNRSAATAHKNAIIATPGKDSTSPPKYYLLSGEDR